MDDSTDTGADTSAGRGGSTEATVIDLDRRSRYVANPRRSRLAAWPSAAESETVR